MLESPKYDNSYLNSAKPLRVAVFSLSDIIDKSL